jgi:hypothetical protein
MNEGNKLLSHTMKEKKKKNLNQSESSIQKKNTYCFTPTPTKKTMLNKITNDETESVNELISYNRINKLINTHTQKLSKNSTHKNKQDSLSDNMPNFVKNYDNLIEIIKINSKDKYECSQFETKDTDYPIVKPFSLPSNTSIINII